MAARKRISYYLYAKQLVVAAREGRIDSVKSILLDYPECINEGNERGEIALLEAARQGMSSTLELLIDAGSLDKQGNYGGIALVGAAFRQSTESVKLLINAGVNLDEQNKIGITALMAAAFHGNAEIINILLAAGANIKIANNDRQTALDMAKESTQSDGEKPLEDAEKGIRPTCEEVGILPPDERISKYKREQSWQSRISASANEKSSGERDII